jgi:hypothetical protein
VILLCGNTTKFLIKNAKLGLNKGYQSGEEEEEVEGPPVLLSWAPAAPAAAAAAQGAPDPLAAVVNQLAAVV